MIRKTTVSLILSIALTLAVLVGLLFTPVVDPVYADGATPTPTLSSGDSGASGGGNTGG